LVLHVLEVTVISTIHVTVAGAPVIVKSLSFVVVFRVSVKNVVAEASGLAFTSMVTPDAGIAELMVTLNGNPGPGAGGSVVPFAGVVAITNVASVPQLSVVFFLQYGMATKTIITASHGKNTFFIDVNIIAVIGTTKIGLNWRIRKLCKS
jgi:hypothetical protein